MDKTEARFWLRLNRAGEDLYVATASDVTAKLNDLKAFNKACVGAPYHVDVFQRVVHKDAGVLWMKCGGLTYCGPSHFGTWIINFKPL